MCELNSVQHCHLLVLFINWFINRTVTFIYKSFYLPTSSQMSITPSVFPDIFTFWSVVFGDIWNILLKMHLIHSIKPFLNSYFDFIAQPVFCWIFSRNTYNQALNNRQDFNFLMINSFKHWFPLPNDIWKQFYTSLSYVQYSFESHKYCPWNLPLKDRELWVQYSLYIMVRCISSLEKVLHVKSPCQVCFIQHI